MNTQQRPARAQKARGGPRRRALLLGVVAAFAIFMGTVAPTGALSASAAWGGYSNGAIPASQLTQIDGYSFRDDAAQSLIQLRAAYRNAVGRTLVINDGYRDLAGQRRAWDTYQNGGNLAAYPGTSNHGWGTAVDFGGEVASSSSSAGHRWLQANARNYGWTWAGKDFKQVEPWHWEYQGGPQPPAGKPVKRDVTGDARSDYLAVRSDGVLVYFQGNGSAGSTAYPLGPGWDKTTALVHGDFTGDFVSDLFQVRSDGSLYFYAGNGGTTFTPTYVGPGWQNMSLVTGGEDFTGDGKADIVARAADGNLYAYPGDGRGHLGNPVRIGTNWTAMNALVAGDFNGDGRGDLAARNAAGELWGYYGTSSGLGLVQKIGTGWGGFSTVFGGGDYDGDGKADVIGRNGSSQDLWLYSGTGNGGFGNGQKIGTGWGGYTVIG